MTGEFSESELREAAMRLLARREHSRTELHYKLTHRGWPEREVGRIIEALAGEGLQSDERFAESFTRMRAEKCYGPVRIRAELAERGVDGKLIDHTLREAEVDWFERAAHFYERRYGGKPAEDFPERARRQQALARRGFAHEHIRELLD